MVIARSSFCVRNWSPVPQFPFAEPAPDFAPVCFVFFRSREGKFPTSCAKGFSGGENILEAPPAVSLLPLYKELSQ